MAKVVESRPAGPTSEAQIAAFEQHIGHRLPDDYRAFLLEHNGGHPDPDSFRMTIDGEQEEDSVMCFFPMRDLALGNVEVEEFEDLRVWPLHCAWKDLQTDLVNLYETELSAPAMPIGTDGSGNYLCVVLEGDRRGSILFLEHEMAEEVPLAADFAAFLQMLETSD